MSGGDSGVYGQMGLFDDNSLYHQIHFMIRQALAEHRTSVPVKILKVHGGGVGKPPTVDVQVMIKQMDGVGQSSSHSTVYGIPVVRNQGGANVVINDPLVGDTGHLIVSDRDISSFKNNDGAESNPGSMRRHDLADGVYHPAHSMPVTPKQYVHFKDGVGIDIYDCNGNKIELTSAGVKINGTLIDLHGNIKGAGDIQTSTNTTLDTHLHQNAGGAGDSGPPVLGT